MRAVSVGCHRRGGCVKSLKEGADARLFPIPRRRLELQFSRGIYLLFRSLECRLGRPQALLRLQVPLRHLYVHEVGQAHGLVR